VSPISSNPKISTYACFSGTQNKDLHPSPFALPRGRIIIRPYDGKFQRQTKTAVTEYGPQKNSKNQRAKIKNEVSPEAMEFYEYDHDHPPILPADNSSSFPRMNNRPQGKQVSNSTPTTELLWLPGFAN
jgi:hypothetical protein